MNFILIIVVWICESVKHVPGFIEKAEEFKAKGVSEILLISGMNFSFLSFDHS